MTIPEPDLINAHFFFVDVVGLSDPSMSTKTQIKKIQVLQNCIKECSAYSNSKDKIVVPTGDGMAIGFLQGPDLPLKLAIELQQKLFLYNKTRLPSELVKVRIGLHSGNVYLIDDILGNKNLWGSGIIMARRVMDFGDSEHILLSKRMAEDLMELSDEYKRIIKPLQELVIKHGQKTMIYNAFDQSFGNSEIPKKALEQITKEDAFHQNKNTLYRSVLVEILIVDDNSQLVHHKRKYEIINTSGEPIKEILHGIATDVPKQSLDDLKIKIYDEKNKEMKISKILANYPYQKEFSTVFNEPILMNQKDRSYTLEYEVEEPERFFENAFMVDCNTFEMVLEYPSSATMQPIFSEINQETEQQIISGATPQIQETEKTTKIRWTKQNVARGHTFRVQW